MDKRRCDVAVIGAGTAGLEAWRAATKGGADALLIERGPGGTTCARVGCMPSKALLAAGRAAHAARGADEFGVLVGSVEVDGAAVMARVRRMRDIMVRSVFEGMDDIPEGKRIGGEARFTGPTTLAVGDLTIEAKAVVIAVGADPMVPDAFADVADRVRTHLDIWELETLPKSLGVLGAGPVGIEIAQAMARLGVEVTVFDPGGTIGALKDEAANAAAVACLEREVTLRLGEKPKGVAVDGGVRLEGEGEPVVVEFVLAATGRPPNLKALDLDKAGVPLGDDGVPAFDPRTKQVADSHVWIAGDANDWRPVLHEANHGGSIAGRGAAGASDDSKLLTSLAMVYTDPGMAVVGTAFADLPDGARIGSATVEGGRAQIDRHEGGVVRLYADRDGQLIGGTIVAHAAEHLAHSLMVAVSQGMTVAAFAALPWYHPCYEELLQAAARDLLEQ